MSRGSRRPRSDVEIMARTRILMGSILIYLLCMGFMAIGDHFYEGTRFVLYSRLATIPLFLLLLRRWVGMVRVRPPQLLLEARKLMQMGRFTDARDRFATAQHRDPGQARRVNRARRLLQDDLAVTLSQETQLEMGRCSLALDEVDRAVAELGEAQSQLPLRADVAMELADAMRRAGSTERAVELMEAAVPHMDAVDRQMLEEQPPLLELLGDTPLPARSRFHRKINRDRVILLVLVALAVAHGLHLYL